jgi:hypothetical protein
VFRGDTTLASTRLGDGSEVRRQLARALLVRPAPVQSSPFPAGLFGFSLTAVTTRFYPCGAPLCRLPFSTKRYYRLSTAPTCASACTSPGVRPLQRSTTAGARIPRRFHPPALSVLRVSNPLDVFLHPPPCRLPVLPGHRTLAGPYAHLLRSWGSTGHPSLARTFRSPQGAGNRVPSSRPSLPP